jgi:hypothetical protein
VDRSRVDELISRGLLEVIKDPVKRDGLDQPIEILGNTEAGGALLHLPLKPRKTIPWHREPKGPGFAVDMFTDAPTASALVDEILRKRVRSEHVAWKVKEGT